VLLHGHQPRYARGELIQEEAAMSERRVAGVLVMSMLSVVLAAGCTQGSTRNQVSGDDAPAAASEQAVSEQAVAGTPSESAQELLPEADSSPDAADAAALAAMKELADQPYQPEIGREDFVSGIDNPYLPLLPGNAWYYEGMIEDGFTQVSVQVLDEEREVMGVPAVAVRKTVIVAGQLVEDTLNWYAQDGEGNVWRLGAAAKDPETGENSGAAGSWEAGVDGALPGVIMPAQPHVGQSYRQDYNEGQAEDMAYVLRVDGEAEVPFGSFDEVLVTEEWSPLEPGVVERKYYVRGVGLVLEETVQGGERRIGLVHMTAVE